MAFPFGNLVAKHLVKTSKMRRVFEDKMAEMVKCQVPTHHYGCAVSFAAMTLQGLIKYVFFSTMAIFAGRTFRSWWTSIDVGVLRNCLSKLSLFLVFADLTLRSNGEAILNAKNIMKSRRAPERGGSSIYKFCNELRRALYKLPARCVWAG